MKIEIRYVPIYKSVKLQDRVGPLAYKLDTGGNLSVSERTLKFPHGIMSYGIFF